MRAIEIQEEIIWKTLDVKGLKNELLAEEIVMNAILIAIHLLEFLRGEGAL